MVISLIKKGLIRMKDEEKDEQKATHMAPWHVYSIAS
jgi:hypothetical protein